jgi:hypothetical protein
MRGPLPLMAAGRRARRIARLPPGGFRGSGKAIVPDALRPFAPFGAADGPPTTGTPGSFTSRPAPSRSGTRRNSEVGSSSGFEGPRCGRVASSGPAK